MSKSFFIRLKEREMNKIKDEGSTMILHI
jgi:hypothetical protein